LNRGLRFHLFIISVGYSVFISTLTFASPSECLREALNSMTDMSEAYQALAQLGINLDHGTTDIRDLNARIITRKASLQSKRIELKHLRTAKILERDRNQKEFLQDEITSIETEIIKQEIELTQAEGALALRTDILKRFLEGDDSAFFGDSDTLLDKIIRNDKRRGLRPAD
jgi:hypothetical protein